MNLAMHEKFKQYKIIIWWYPYGSHTHSWIHHGFYRAFTYLGYDVKWVDNKIENLPAKNDNTIFITEHQVDNFLIENLSTNWIIFDHNIEKNRWNNNPNIIPFSVKTFSVLSNKEFNYDMYRYYISHPQIYWWTDLLPHEIQFIPYNYNNKDIIFIWSWWQNNFLEIEKLHLWALMNWKKFIQSWKHLLLRHKKFVPEKEVPMISRSAYIAPAIQWNYQCKVGYTPCRLLKNISYSVLGVSNNIYMANLFPDDEIIIDGNIFHMMEKAEKVIKDKKVDDYTKKAIERVKNEHTYINRIEELFSYLQ